MCGPDYQPVPDTWQGRCLLQIAAELVRPGRGILAADESIPTIGKRFAKHHIENTEDNRRQYRELFITAEGISSSLSGVILNPETLSQTASDGQPFCEILKQAGIAAGVKVDEGLEALQGCEGESHTKGLENLARNCKAYARQGATFSKWRAAFKINQGKPSAKAIEVNAKELASYAAISQAEGLVPIVEPEILIDGEHSIAESAEAASCILRVVVARLEEKNVDLGACLLKLQMILPGSEADAASPEEIATATVQVISRCVPIAAAGVVFLSGGQTEEQATINLNAIVKYGRSHEVKCGLTFSYGRSLQASVLELWSKDIRSPTQKEEAQKMAIALAAVNASATLGHFHGAHPSSSSGTLKEAFRGWT